MAMKRGTRGSNEELDNLRNTAWSRRDHIRSKSVWGSTYKNSKIMYEDVAVLTAFYVELLRLRWHTKDKHEPIALSLPPCSQKSACLSVIRYAVKADDSIKEAIIKKGISFLPITLKDKIKEMKARYREYRDTYFPEIPNEQNRKINRFLDGIYKHEPIGQ